MSQFTLVRHGAYAVGADADFEDAVEPFELSEQQAYRVRSAGGLLFASLADARAAAGAENFPPGTVGARARAEGYFSSLRLGGAEIYVPRPASGGGTRP